jgi:hypothetical protein
MPASAKDGPSVFGGGGNGRDDLGGSAADPPKRGRPRPRVPVAGGTKGSPEGWQATSLAQEQLMMDGIGGCAPESQVRIGLAAGGGSHVRTRLCLKIPC